MDGRFLINQAAESRIVQKLDSHRSMASLPLFSSCRVWVANYQIVLSSEVL